MRKIQELAAAMMLLIALSISAPAGEITTGAVSPPPPPASATATEPGHITTDATTAPMQSTIESETLVTEIALSLLQLLSVL